MFLQVLLLCWLRAIVHYQYAKGGTMAQAARVRTPNMFPCCVDSLALLLTAALPARARQAMWAQGGLPRFYQGMLPALVHAPLCRFGDTAANAGALSLLAYTPLPLPLKTGVASAAAAAWRVAITPLDTVKVVLEVEGFARGSALLRARVALAGPRTLYAGALGAAAAAAAAHWPWFLTHNALTARFGGGGGVQGHGHGRGMTLARSAAIGFVASLASDVAANPLRVLKAAVQTAPGELSYGGALAGVVAQGGVGALLTRGLGAKLCVNALQGVVFSVLWRVCGDALAARRARAAAAAPPPRGDVEAQHKGQ
jgi:hypothetical protein